jgi:hypothetical protein
MSDEMLRTLLILLYLMIIIGVLGIIHHDLSQIAEILAGKK